MPLTLYYLEASPPARTVDLVIHALGITAVNKPVDVFKNEHLTPEYLKLNSMHTIPMIDDDGFILWESHAIMTYLVSKYGKDDTLYPKDLKKRAIVDQRLHFSNDVFYAFKLVTKPLIFQGGKVTEEQIAKLKEMQDSVEKLLEGHKFMAGDHLTVADYSYITMMDLLEVYAPAENRLPLTKAWFERCKSTMKDFHKVNDKGAKISVAHIKEKLEYEMSSAKK